jgi:hypothetical protein
VNRGASAPQKLVAFDLYAVEIPHLLFIGIGLARDVLPALEAAKAIFNLERRRA